MERLCSNIVKNIECWVCHSQLVKKRTRICWIIKCTNRKCQAHAILVTKEELDDIENDDKQESVMDKIKKFLLKIKEFFVKLFSRK
jgi:hypothetical protein